MTPTELDPAVAAQLKSVAVGSGIFLLLDDYRPWVHRRVEAVSFKSGQTIRRRVSVDCTILAQTPSVTWYGNAAAPPLRLLPLALLKKGPLAGFDLRDEMNRPVPVLTTPQNTAVTVQAIRTPAEQISGSSLSERTIDDIETIVSADPSAASAAAQSGIGSAAAASADSALAFIGARLEPWLNVLAENFVLVALLPAHTGERRILKFAYDQPFDPEATQLTLRQRFAWDPLVFRLSIPGIKEADSYHFELTVPDGSSITEGSLGDAALRPAVSFAFERPGRRGGVPEIHLHAAIDGREVRQPVAAAALHAARPGWFQTSLGFGFVIALLLVATALRLPGTALHGKAATTAANAGLGELTGGTATAAALFLPVLGLIAFLLGTVGEHALTGRLLLGARSVVILQALLPFVGGWFLFFGPHGNALFWSWRAFAVVAVGLELVLYRGYRGRRIPVKGALKRAWNWLGPPFSANG